MLAVVFGLCFRSRVETTLSWAAGRDDKKDGLYKKNVAASPIPFSPTECTEVNFSIRFCLSNFESSHLICKLVCFITAQSQASIIVQSLSVTFAA